MECANCHVGVLQEPQDRHPSYLICPNCGAIELTYEPQDYQLEIHNIPYRYDKKGRIRAQIIGVFGGYGSGKSRASLEEFLFRALENPGGRGLFTAPTLQQLKRTTLNDWFGKYCPPPFIEYYNKTDMEIRLINGFTIYCIASDDEEKIRSINAGLIHMEEASGIKRTIYDQLLTRMRDPFVKNRAIFVCSNPDIGWIKDVFVENLKKKDPKHPLHHEYNPFIETFIWATDLNKHLPDDYIEVNSTGKPEWWIKRYLKGSFDHSEGMVYPNIINCFKLSSEVVSQDPKIADEYGIPKDWERFITLDHGLTNPTAVYFHAIDPVQGRVITYLEYYQSGRTVPDHAHTLRPLIEKIPYGRLRFMVGDPSIRNKTDPVDGKSVQALYQEYGIYWTPGNNNIEAGILKVNSYIERGKWVILSDRCPNLCKELINYKYPDVSMDDMDKNRDEKPVKAHDHACFIAGTLIETLNGQKPIEVIQVGDEVLTRQGYKRVVNCGLTDHSAVVKCVMFSNGASFVATGNHPVWVEGKGFLPTDSLRYGDIVHVSPNWGKSVCQKSLRGFVQTSVSRNGVEKTDLIMRSGSAQFADENIVQIGSSRQRLVRANVVGIFDVQEKQAVYNITVEDAHEYFANGVLVHNCDSIRYGFMRLPDDPELLKTPSFAPEKRYNRGIKNLNEWHYDPDEFDESERNRDWTSYGY